MVGMAGVLRNAFTGAMSQTRHLHCLDPGSNLGGQARVESRGIQQS